MSRLKRWFCGNGEQQGGYDRRHQYLVKADPVCPHRGDLVVTGQPSKGRHGGYQDGHGDRYRDRERNREQEDLDDYFGAQSFAGKRLELPGHLVHQHDKRENDEPEDERTEVFAECVQGQCAGADPLLPSAHQRILKLRTPSGPPNDWIYIQKCARLPT
jgi:hypothetical protein